MNLDFLLEEAVKHPEKRPDFEKTLIRSNIFVIGKKQVTKTADGADELAFNLFTINHDDGNKLVPFFTSVARLELFGSKIAEGDVPYFEMNCMDFFASIKGRFATLNPNCKYQKQFTDGDIQEILDGKYSTVEERIYQEGKAYIVGTPKDFPEGLASALADFFKKSKIVHKAYMLLITYQEGEPRNLLVVDFDGEKGGLLTDISNVSQEFMKPSETMNVIAYDTSFAQKITAGVTPFYTRKKGLFGK
ncbi:MAG: enhanced serine sensitivity protein SseB C-terminal domain-containing protein [Oscillospiraceae bacterium]